MVSACGVKSALFKKSVQMFINRADFCPLSHFVYEIGTNKADEIATRKLAFAG